MSEKQMIEAGATVTMHFALYLEDGTEVEDTFGKEPLTFTMGDETLVPGLEMALYGLGTGDTQTIDVGPEHTWGEREADGMQTMPMSDFPEDMSPEVGHIIAFTTPTGEEVPGAVMEIDGDTVHLDFNHPLAGHEVTFKTEILDVQPAE